MNSLLIFFIFSLGKTLDLNFSYPVVASECSDEKHYAKVIKVSGSRGNKETFTISGTINGMETILVTGAAVLQIKTRPMSIVLTLQMMGCIK